MYTSIKEIPISPETHNFAEDYVMIHNLSNPSNSTTTKVKVKDLIKDFVGKQKIKVVEMDQDHDIADIDFEIQKGEIVLVKVHTQHNDADVYDGYVLYLFVKEGVGKFRGERSSEEGEVITTDDFVVIHSSLHGDEVQMDEHSYQGSFGLFVKDVVQDYSLDSVIRNITENANSKHERPIINLSWGEKGKIVNINRSSLPPLYDGTQSMRDYIVNNSQMSLLQVELLDWEVFRKFISKGGEIRLLIHKRKKPKFNENNANIQRLGHRWSFNKNAEQYGGKTSFLLNEKMSWLDIYPEFLIKNGFDNHRNYLDKNCNIKREKLGFALEFKLNEAVSKTAVLEELDLIFMNTNVSERPHLITFRKK